MAADPTSPDYLFFSEIVEIVLAVLVLSMAVPRFLSIDVFPRWLYIGGKGVLTETIPILVLALVTLSAILIENRTVQRKITVQIAAAGIGIVTVLLLFGRPIPPTGRNLLDRITDRLFRDTPRSYRAWKDRW